MADKIAQTPPQSTQRRNFLIKTAAVILGGIAAAVPVVAGLFTFADPLRRRTAKSGDGFIRVANLDAVPDDGVPRQFAIIADRSDAWNRFPQEAIGVVYLRRKKGEKTPEALNAICPHAGCFVAYATERSLFQCPCHNSAFQLDGAIIQPSPSPRPMDQLEVKLVEESADVWVKFQDYLPGREEKIPKV